MLISDKTIIGNRILKARKRLGLTQAQAAEKAGLSDRAYADIERGSKNMTVASLCKICAALDITPDRLLKNDPEDTGITDETVLAEFQKCTYTEKEGAVKILSAYMDAIKKLSLKDD